MQWKSSGTWKSFQKVRKKVPDVCSILPKQAKIWIYCLRTYWYLFWGKLLELPVYIGYKSNWFQEIRLKHGFKLRLTDLLIKPIQRLTKYHMLLEAILKHSQRAGLVEEAVAIEQAFHVMTVVPNQANDMMDIGRLQGFEVH